jgi:hypothetical protein
MWNSRQGKHCDKRGHRRDPKGSGVLAFGCGVHDAQQPPPFQTPNDIFRYTTKELCSVAAQYATSNEVVKLHAAPGSREVTLSSGKEASSNVAVQDAKGEKKRRKQHP